MGKNYRVMPVEVDKGVKKELGEVHIGKRVAVGGGRMCFVWAVHPSKFYTTLKENCDLYPYFREWEVAEKAIAECDEHDYSQIGTGFN